MENLDGLIAYAIPAVVAIICVLQIMKGVVERERIKVEGKVVHKKIETIYPLQLQAYERLCMLMERLSPDNLIIRTNKSGLNVVQFQQILFAEINQEYNHNMSQQIYVSDKAWTTIKTSVELLKTVINRSAMEITNREVAVSTDLAKRILENSMSQNIDPIQEALKVLRAEIKKL